MDRAHRLGQRRTVNVYRLLVRGTLEEHIMGLQRFKLDVAGTPPAPATSSPSADILIPVHTTPEGAGDGDIGWPVCLQVPS